MSDIGTVSAEPPARAFQLPPARWILPECDPNLASALRESLSVHPVTARILAARGFADPAAAREFLSPQLSALHDPFSILGMDRAVARLKAALANRESILLYGDYDVDGTSSVAVLKKALEILGGRVDFHVPHRLKEGYGLRADVIERAAAKGVQLIVSVDTGIRAAQAVHQANRLGMEVIITDHHLPDAELPPALTVLNPNQHGCSYPNKNLCGAGVVFKLVQALLAKSELTVARQNALLDSFLKPVAIATVADIVPLTGENRVIVRRGLLGLSQVRNPGLRSLLEVAGFDEGECPSAHQVAFRLAPRINAAGRMDDARHVIELFLTADLERARELAGQLDALNRERQKIEAEIVEQILAECESRAAHALDPAMVFAGSGWHLGVLGIVASRLVERFSRPVFVLSDAPAEASGIDGCFSGSGRSIAGFHLLEALESMPELFTKFGGHRQAAGLTLPAENVESFRTQFAAFAGSRLNEDDLRPRFSVDAIIELSDLTSGCVQQLLNLGPFGFGNPNPILMASELEIAGPPRVIREGKHFNVPVRHGNRVFWCKAWNFNHHAPLLQPGSQIDALLQIEDDPYSRKRGYESWCITLKDIRPQ
jgi:single-stranded-DNA-specific exonuclease